MKSSRKQKVERGTVRQYYPIHDEFSNTFSYADLIKFRYQTVFIVLLLLTAIASLYFTLLHFAMIYILKKDEIPKEFGDYMFYIYVFDVVHVIDNILIVIFYKLKPPELKCVYELTPVWIVIVRIVTLFPIDGIYWIFSKVDMHVLHALRLRYTIRVITYTEYLQRFKFATSNKFYVLQGYIEFTVGLLVIIVIVSCIVHHIYCIENLEKFVCTYKHGQKLKSIVGHIISISSKRGFIHQKIILRHGEIVTTLATYLVFLLCYGYIIGILVVEIYITMSRKHLFANSAVKARNQINILLKGDHTIQKTYHQLITIYWQKRNYAEFVDDFETRLPESIISDLKLDISWPAFKHSHLFKFQELTFLRYVASLMEHTFMIPGQIVYKKGELKRKMIYLVSGVVQLLSEEDDETPIISFSGGTILGESCLIQDYPCSCTVSCLTYCVIYVLPCTVIPKLFPKYVKHFKKLLEDVHGRESQAATYKKIAKYQTKDMHQQLSFLSLKYVKTAVQRLNNKMNMEDIEQEEIHNYELQRTNRNLRNIIFCAKYLDLLVLAAERDQQIDASFVNRKYPHILKPDSFLYHLWQNWIALLALLLALSYPYFVPFSPDSTFYKYFLYFITIFWILDVFIKLNKAVFISNVLVHNIYDIVWANIFTVSFWLDVFAVLPFEINVYMNVDISDQTYMLFMCNRLLKARNVPMCFEHRFREFTHYKVLIYSILLLFYSSAMFYLTLCFHGTCTVESSLTELFLRIKDAQLIVALYYGHQVVTGNMITAVIPSKAKIVFLSVMAVCIISVLLHFYYLSQLICFYFFNFQDVMKINNRIKLISYSLNNYKLSKNFMKRVLNFYQDHWRFDSGRSLLGRKYMMPGLPKDVHDNVWCNLYYKQIKLIPVIREMPSGMLFELCLNAKIRIFHPNEVLIYHGEVGKEFFYLLNGYCMTTDGNVSRLLKPLDTFSVIDCCMQLPSYNTVCTLTYVTVLAIPYNDFIKAINNFPYTVKWFNIIKKDLEEQKQTYKPNIGCVNMESIRTERSVYVFNSKAKQGSKQWKEYYLPFTKKKCYYYLRFFLLRRTFFCGGRFVFIAELSRVFFAISTVFIIMLPTTGYCRNCPLWFLLFIFDITGWVDVYIRHHITYYNKFNIEVTHPLQTAFHYWTHAFVVDLIALLPFNAIVIFLATNVTSGGFWRLIRLNRVLQMYRLLPFLKIYELDGATHKWAIIKIIPLIFLSLYTLGFLVMEKDCNFHPSFEATETTVAGVFCRNDSWLTLSKFRKPLTVTKVFLYSLFYVTASLSGIAMSGYECNSNVDCTLIWLPAFIGFLIFIYFMAMFAAVHLNANFYDTLYQHHMRNFIRFLNSYRMDVNVRSEVIHHFQLLWKRNKGQDLQNITIDLHNSLRSDILFDAFVPSLRMSKVFAEADSLFLRTFLVKSSYQLFLNRGIISRVNDIQENIYIIIKGNVEVSGPDNSLLFLLPAGSVFGNLDKCQRSRMTLTMAAKGLVSVLTIKTMQFYEALNSSRKFEMDFLRRIAVHVDYLAGGPIQLYGYDAYNDNEEIKSKSRKYYEFFFGVKKPGNSIFWWEIFVSVTVFFFTLPFETFHLCVRNSSVGFAVFLYFLDAIYVVQIFIKFHTCYEDDFGILITDKKKIAKRYLHNLLGFAIDLAAIIPFDIISLFFISTKNVWNVWSFGRANRLIKVYFVIKFLRKKRRQLNVSIFSINLAYSIVWLTVYILITTIVIANLSCLHPNYNFDITHYSINTMSFSCDWSADSLGEKIKIFFDFLRITINCLTGIGLPNIYPAHPTLILTMVFVMIFSKIVVILFATATLSNLFTAKMNLMEIANNAEKLRIYMHRENVSLGLMQNIWNYVWLLWRNNHGEQIPSFLHRTPYYLREAILNSAFGYHLQDHPVLGKFHIDLLRQIAASLRPRFYFPGDYITFINDLDEKMYFIHEGVVEALIRDTVMVVKVKKVLNENDMFGLEQGLNPQKGQFYTYKARIYTVMLVLDHKAWFHLLDFFPASKAIVDQLSFDKTDDT